MIVLQKILTELILPCGLIWLLLIGACLLAWRYRQRLLLGVTLAMLVVYSLAGNRYLAETSAWYLERDYEDIDPMQEDSFDAVVVLGGGTCSGPQGQTQLSGVGDRVMLAARLYKSGRTRRLICTGQRIAELSPTGRDPAEETAQIWRELGIPEEDVICLPGRNTHEEMLQIGILLRHNEWQRVGLVTSAWHMPRALHLAARENLAMIPLPANIGGGRPQWSPLTLIPSPAGFAGNQAAVRELLGSFLGR